MAMRKTVACIGLGNMGGQLAKRIAGNNVHQVLAYDATDGFAESFVQNAKTDNGELNMEAVAAVEIANGF